MSKETPQLENGYTRIANELYEAIIKQPFNGYESRVLHAIIRKTYGYGKKSDYIAFSQISELTGIAKTHISRTITALTQYKVVTKLGNSIGVNKDASQWAVTKLGNSKKALNVLPKLVMPVTKLGIKKLPKSALQKKKENITKEKEVLDMFNKAMNTKYRTVPHKNLEYWLSIYSLEEIGEAIGNITKDGFWKDKMSPEVLFRRKDPKGNDVDRLGSLLNRKSEITSSYKKYDPNDPRNI